MKDPTPPSRPEPGPAERGPLPRRRLGRLRTAERVPASCPHLRPGSGEAWALAGPSPGDRCRAGERSAHVSAAYRASVCRGPGHRDCPRFVASERLAAPAADATGRQGRRLLLRTGIPSVVAHQQWAEEPVRRKAPTDRPGQAPAAPAGTSPRKSRRRASLAELTVVALGLSIVLACLFVGYAIVYRMQMSVGIEVAAAPPRTLSATAPTGATLVPTFTATPSPGALSGPGMTATALPTPVPEAAAPKPAAPEPTPVVRPRAESPPTRLVIPKIDVDIPVLPVAVRVATIAGQERAIWSDVPRAGAFHETSAYPGNPGNTVINGHRDILGSVFRHLDRLEAGDQILVYVGDQVYPYFVTERLVVPDTFASAAQRAENAKLIGYFPEERLTLITCTPLGLATHRLVVVAKPLARLAPRSPEADWHSGP